MAWRFTATASDRLARWNRRKLTGMVRRRARRPLLPLAPTGGPFAVAGRVTLLRRKKRVGRFRDGQLPRAVDVIDPTCMKALGVLVVPTDRRLGVINLSEVVGFAPNLLAELTRLVRSRGKRLIWLGRRFSPPQRPPYRAFLMPLLRRYSGSVSRSGTTRRGWKTTVERACTSTGLTTITKLRKRHEESTRGCSRQIAPEQRNRKALYMKHSRP